MQKIGHNSTVIILEHITHISPSRVNEKVVSGPEKIVSKNK